VLFDTNVVSYWAGGIKAFEDELSHLLLELDASKASLYVSAITVQELGVYSAVHANLEKTRNFIQDNFTVLEFTEACALEAVRIGSTISFPKKGGKSEREEAKMQWHRDIAILGSASHHGMQMLVTANFDDFRSYQNEVSLTIRRLRETVRNV